MIMEQKFKRLIGRMLTNKRDNWSKEIKAVKYLNTGEMWDVVFTDNKSEMLSETTLNSIIDGKDDNYTLSWKIRSLGKSQRKEKMLKGYIKHPKMNTYHTPKAKARRLAKLQRKARRVSYASQD